MAGTVAAAELALQKQEAKFYLETTRESGFAPYMGTGAGAIIKRKEDLMSNGESITIPLVLSMSDAAIGTGTLEGNEEAIKNHGYRCVPIWHRKANSVPKNEQHKTAIDLYKAQRDTLGMWRVHRQRNQIIEAMSAVAAGTDPVDEEASVGKQKVMRSGTAGAGNNIATEAEVFTWMGVQDTAGRIVIGDGSVGVTVDTPTTMAQITAGMVMSPDIGRLAKSRARVRDEPNGRWQVRPVRKNGYDKEYYVCFVGSGSYNALAASDEMQAANRDARPRSVGKNPLFQDGDLLLNGIIYREIPEIWSYTGLTSTDYGTITDVEPFYMCGAEALAHAVGQRPKATRSSSDDYQFIRGIGSEELFSVEKAFFNGTQHGMVNGFVATTPTP